MDASRFTILMGHQQQEEDMAINLLAIDLGKRSFHIFGIDQDGVIVSRKVSRAKLCETIDTSPSSSPEQAEGCGAVRRALLCCGCHRVGARVATCNSRRVKKLVRGAKPVAV